MKITNKHQKKNIKYYYHSTDIYNSLIYTQNNSSKNIISQKDRIEFLFSKIKKKFLRFNKIDNQFVFFDGSLNSKIMINSALKCFQFSFCNLVKFHFIHF